MLVYKTQSPAETFLFGQKIAGLLTAGDVLCLAGDLGAGKTLFTQGLAQGMGFREDVTSPTFAIMNVYEAKIPIYHFDLYRLDYAEQLYDIGFEEYTGRNSSGMAVIEWPDKFPEALPDENLWIEITSGQYTEERLLRIKPNGEYYQKLCEELKVIADTCFRYSDPSL
ncbi:MAG: tRNA (adenosine(37)-N6)-threonylcarbamoyltransferase complex ATPase subunit type 1 TsaE [Pelosinus sp.]|nr:tRNA (adenosine(37)-N6)-threonylcarbamoyltransferase complex ATPase subunit type 1 TsaE [Pelosinus sp.]